MLVRRLEVVKELCRGVGSVSSVGSAGFPERADYFGSMHIRTSGLQKVLLSVGAAAVALANPARGDMVATLGETTGAAALRYVRDTMQQSPEGRAILRDKPRINSRTVDLDGLSRLPADTLGRVYYDWLVTNKVTPDSRADVQFVDDYELAYVMQRYRETHDLVHALLFMPTNMLGEVTVKWVEGLQTGLPMCLAGGLLGALRLAPKQRRRYLDKYLPWAVRTGLQARPLITVYFEKRWHQPVQQLYSELNIPKLNP